MRFRGEFLLFKEKNILQPEQWIRIQHFKWLQTEEKNTDEKFFFDQKFQFTYVQATVEAFSPQKRTNSTLKN
jgi:hypothetical protein